MEYYLKIAEMKIAGKEDTIKTVVGSCVALCLWDQITLAGGMVHIMMPESNGYKVESKGKYADTAVETLLNEMIKNGCKKENLIARISGGASMFGSNNVKIADLTIGEKNSQKVKQYLNKFNISIKSEDTGGRAGRRVVFEPSTGKITIKTLDTMLKNNMEKNSEKNYSIYCR